MTMPRLKSLSKTAALFCCVAFLIPAVATAQSIRGHGEVPNDGESPSQISVNAWLDDDGVAHGAMIWVGAVVVGSNPKAGPADPFLIEVLDIVFDGNTAYVFGVVVHSVFPFDIGTAIEFAFTDNSGTGEPDEIGGAPIVAGNFTIND